MEEEKQLAGEDRLSGEIVEVYRQPLPGEVVERYSRPLPGRPAAPGQPRRRRRTGLWIFLACLAVVLAGAFGFNQWLHTGRDLPAMETAEDTADAGSGLDGSGNSGDAPAAPRYSVGVEIGEIDVTVGDVEKRLCTARLC